MTPWHSLTIVLHCHTVCIPNMDTAARNTGLNLTVLLEYMIIGKESLFRKNGTIEF